MKILKKNIFLMVLLGTGALLTNGKAVLPVKGDATEEATRQQFLKQIADKRAQIEKLEDAPFDKSLTQSERLVEAEKREAQVAALEKEISEIKETKLKHFVSVLAPSKIDAMMESEANQEKTRLGEIKATMGLTSSDKDDLISGVQNRISLLESYLKYPNSAQFAKTPKILGYPADTKLETLIKDKAILKNYLAELEGTEPLESKKTETPAKASEKDKEPLAKALEGAASDEAALTLLHHRTNLSAHLEDRIGGKTILSRVVNKNYFDTAEFLVNQGADVNAQDADNDKFSPFVTMIERLAVDRLKSKEDIIKKLARLMLTKGGDLDYAEKKLKEIPECMSFIAELKAEQKRPEEVKQEQDKAPQPLTHLTKDRPKGPLHRRLPTSKRAQGSKEAASASPGAQEEAVQPTKSDDIKKDDQSSAITDKTEKEVSNETSPSQENAQEDCTICLDELSPENSDNQTCGHSFHKGCIDEWLKDHTTCPNCRAKLKPEAPKKQQASFDKKDTEKTVQLSSEKKESTEDKKDKHQQKKKRHKRKKQKTHSYREKKNKKLIRRKRQERIARHTLRQGEKNKKNQSKKSSKRKGQPAADQSSCPLARAACKVADGSCSTHANKKFTCPLAKKACRSGGGACRLHKAKAAPTKQASDTEEASE